MANFSLGVLEFGLIKPPKLHAYQTINAVLEEISIYEELGYKRFWMSEHYSPEFAWYSPEMLLPLLAGYSSTIKVGWAGVLIRYHRPLALANNFKLLSAIYDDRIDLGIASAFISPNASYHLADADSDNWPKKVKTLLSLLRNTKDEALNTQHFDLPPHGTSLPNLWSLASSAKAIEMVVENDMNLSLSLMHPGSNYTANVDTIKRFKELYFNTHGMLPQTSALVSFAVTSDTRAIRLLEKRYSIEGFSNLFGPADYIQEKLHQLAETLETDEFVLYNPYCDRSRRVEQYSMVIHEPVNKRIRRALPTGR